MVEVWKDVIDFPGYQVSNLGRVRSFRGFGLSGLRDVPHILKQLPRGSTVAKLRMCVHLMQNSVTHTRNVHTIVLETFIGPRPEGYDASHINNNHFDNRLDNLCWDTKHNNRSVNVIASGSKKGIKNAKTKLNNCKVKEVRHLYQQGMSQAELGRKFGVTKQSIYSIVHGKTWTHIK